MHDGRLKPRQPLHRQQVGASTFVDSFPSRRRAASQGLPRFQPPILMAVVELCQARPLKSKAFPSLLALASLAAMVYNIVRILIVSFLTFLATPE